jgi:hypothetical protein
MGTLTAVVSWSTGNYCKLALVGVGKAHEHEQATGGAPNSTQGFVHSSYGEAAVAQTWPTYLTRPTMA